MPQETWSFEKWFVAQHGPRPSKKSHAYLEEQVRQLGFALYAARELLQRTDLWDERRTSALYAWQIPDGQKRGERG